MSVRFDKEHDGFIVEAERTTDTIPQLFIPSAFAYYLHEYMKEEDERDEFRTLVENWITDSDTYGDRLQKLITVNPDNERWIIESAATKYLNFLYYDCSERDTVDREEILIETICEYEEE